MNESKADRVVTTAHDAIATNLVSVSLERIRNHTKPWGSMTQAEQTRVINDVKQTVDRAVRDAISVLAGAERPVIRATVEQVVFKEGIKAVLVADRDNAERHALADAQGQSVLVVVREGMDDYAAGMEEIKAEADQRALDLPTEDDAAQAAPEADAVPEPDDAVANQTPALTIDDVLMLLDDIEEIEPPPADVVAEWTDEQRMAAYEWARRTLLAAGDVSVELPTRPLMLDRYTRTEIRLSCKADVINPSTDKIAFAAGATYDAVLMGDGRVLALTDHNESFAVRPATDEDDVAAWFGAHFEIVEGPQEPDSEGKEKPAGGRKGGGRKKGGAQGKAA